MVTRSRRLVAVLSALAIVGTLLAAPATATGENRYDDLAAGSDFSAPVQALEWAGILTGTECAEGAFCPDDPLTREVLAVWLVRVLDGGDPAGEPSGRFADVRTDRPWAAHIERSVEMGITEECLVGDPPIFCPDASVTRGQAASLLVKAFDLPEGLDSGFKDLRGVKNSPDINALAASNITNGCSTDPLLYCPSRNITRAEMATLLARALRLVPRPGFESTLLPTDPAVRIGTLDNGFTYYLRSNDSPGNSMTMRLVVKAGSVNEPEPELGIAHFLEHVLFKGTEAYPGEALNSTIRNLGAELGPDTNAYVGYDQTVYELTVTADPIENVGTALHVLSQLAHAATIDPDATVTERGVVVDELRLRTATGSGQISTAFDRIYTEGTPYEGYHPIGTIPSIESTTSDDLRTFYETWYVPSNMAIVAVGDTPLDDLQALVQEHFGPIPPGEAPPFSLPEVVPSIEPSYYVLTHEEQGYTYISLDIPIPVTEHGTDEGERLALMERLIRLMVENRLDDAYYRNELLQVDRPNFVSFDYGNALRFYGTNWQGEKLDAASAAYMSVLLTVEKYGFTDADVARATKQLTTTLEYELESAATRNDPTYADRFLSHFLVGGDLSAPQDRFDRLTALLGEMKAAELSTRYRWLMNRAGPIFIAVGPDPAGLPTTSELAAAVDAAVPRREPPPVEEEIDELMPLPEPVEPVASGPVDVLEGYEWEFANGTKVVFVHSEIAEATVNFRTRSLGGWSLLEPGGRALAPRAVEAVLASGFGDLSKSQINRFLDGNTASVSAFIGERVEGFSGASDPEDLETAFQMMHMLITAPRVDEIAFAEARNGATIRTALAEVRPAWQAWVAYNEVRFGLEWHRPVATREQLSTMSPASLLDIFQRRLGDVDDMVVAVVGDVDAEVVERLARHYIGTLPAGEDDTFVNRHRPFPEGLTRREIPVGADMSAVLEISHEAEIEITPSSRVNAYVLRILLDNLLFLLVREELGASYVAGVTINPAFLPTHNLYSHINVTSDGPRLDSIHNRVLSILEDLVADGPAADELKQAKAVAASDFDKESNARLLGMLSNRINVDDDNLLTVERSLSELDKVTAATVQALAAELYGKPDRIEIVRVPASSSEESGN